MKTFRYSFANLLLFIVVVGIALGWLVDHRRSNHEQERLETELEQVYDQLRERELLSGLYQVAKARSSSSRLELEQCKDEWEQGLQTLDYYLDAHRRSVQSKIYLHDVGLKLMLGSKSLSAAARQDLHSFWEDS